MNVLGIDPGLATIGLGLIEAPSSQAIKALDWLTIKTKADQPIQNRLQEIAVDLTTYLDETKPNLVVVEKIFFAANEQTAIDVAQARGVILQAIAARQLPLIEVTPLQLKAALTDDGRADKKQVQDMLVRLLKLDDIPQPDDAADALALAVYGTIIQSGK